MGLVAIGQGCMKRFQFVYVIGIVYDTNICTTSYSISPIRTPSNSPL